jgi:hypothetical protein
MRPVTQKILQNFGTVVGIIFGGLGMVIGIAASPIVGGLISLFVIIIFGSFFGTQYFRKRRRALLLETGIQAKGKIIEIWDSAITINNQPQIGMKIEVYPLIGKPFISEVNLVISRLQTSYYQPGLSCVVRYDPNNTKTVAIESLGEEVEDTVNAYDYKRNFQTQNNASSFGNPYFPGMSEQQIEQWLVKMDTEAKWIAKTGVECKAIIIKNEFTNVFVQDVNAVNLFELEMQIEGMHSYTAKCFGIISPTSASKFQVGNQIWVKYDRNDKNKVALSHA